MSSKDLTENKHLIQKKLLFSSAKQTSIECTIMSSKSPCLKAKCDGEVVLFCLFFQPSAITWIVVTPGPTSDRDLRQKIILMNKIILYLPLLKKTWLLQEMDCYIRKGRDPRLGSPIIVSHHIPREKLAAHTGFKCEEQKG